MIRLDKFLKLSRLVKRRIVAQNMAKIGAVRLNQRTAKASTEVSKEDILEIAYPRRVLTVRVIEDQEPLLKRGVPAYELVSEQRVSEEERPW